jgi:hypothetical protein
MSDNGKDPQNVIGIPPNLEWDENNPPIIFPCSDHIEHMPNCNGECGEGAALTEYGVLLSNEAKDWARVGLAPDGVAVNSLDSKMQIDAVQQLLVEAGILDKDEIDELYRKLKYEVLHNMRQELEPQIREAKTAAMLGVNPKGPRLLGPHGEQL